MPDLYGLNRGRAQSQAYATLRKANLRLGRERLHICGDNRSRGMVVKQFPAAGESVPVRSAVDVWVAIPVDATVVINFDGLDEPCQRPSSG